MKKDLKKTRRLLENLYCSAIIVAAGKGTRMGDFANKQYLDIMDRPVLSYTLEAFEDCLGIDEIIVVVQQEDIILCKDIIEEFGIRKVRKIIVGGKERHNSVYNGLLEIKQEADIVVVHDGARPLINPADIDRVIEAAYICDAAVLGVKVKDTIKMADDDNNIIKTLNRDRLWNIQTPQAFKVEILKGAYANIMEKVIIPTDDSSLVEEMGYNVKIIEGSYTNIKITTPEDLLLAESILDELK